MAKRGAEEQISKDDFDSRRGGDSDEDVSCGLADFENVD